MGVFIDGVYRSRAASALRNFLDIDNLQVLRSPRGTLFGKNTTAGALLLASASPGFDTIEGLVDVGVSNYSTVLARAAVNVPMSDTLSVRVAGLASTRRLLHQHRHRPAHRRRLLPGREDGIWIPHVRYSTDAGTDPVLSGSRLRFAPKFQGPEVPEPRSSRAMPRSTSTSR